MASTPSAYGRVELMADGENESTWGQKTNNNLSIHGRMIAGYVTYPMVAGNNTLTATDYLLGNWHHLVWRLTGALASNANLVVPTFEKMYLIHNETTGAGTVTVKTASGTGVTVPQGQRALVYCDGVNVTGTVIQPYGANISSIAGIADPGLLSRKSDGSWVAREIKGTDEQITVTQGLGETGNPTLSLNSNLVLPGTLRTTGGVSVSSGGVTITTGGLTVLAGNGRFAGSNAAVHVVSSSGFGSVEVSGQSGGVIDLKTPESDDFDIRLITEGTGGSLISQQGLTLQTSNASQAINLNVGTSTTIAQVNSAGLQVLSGFEDIVNLGNLDASTTWRNSARTWNAGVRGGGIGTWSLRNNGVDTIVVNSDGQLVSSNSLTVSSGSVVVSAGNLTVSGGIINFANTSSFESRGILDSSTATTLYVRGGNVGINAGVPQAQLHMGSLARQSNANIRMETGNGGANFRAWDMGVNFGEYNWYVTDTTAGVRRLTIGIDGRVTVNGGFDVTGSNARFLNGASVLAGGFSAVGGTTLTKSGGGDSLVIANSANTGADGAQVRYGGQAFNAFTRVSQANGAFEFVNTDYSSRTFVITQDGTALNPTGTYAAISDERLKENIKTSKNYLSDLCKLRVVDYSLKSEGSDKPTKLGFVAQEVQKVMPQLVLDSGEMSGIDNALSINLTGMVPMLVTAIKELNRKIARLEKATFHA